MMSELNIEDIAVIAENDHGYRFVVGRIGERWIGFACGSAHAARAREAFREEGLEPDPDMMFIFPEIADGYQMGVLDRRRCVLLTGAIAQDPEASYGGVDRWYVGPDLRGKPEDFRCASCDRVGCDGSTCGDDYDYDDEAMDP